MRPNAPDFAQLKNSLGDSALWRKFDLAVIYHNLARAGLYRGLC
jgi:hypothetical protein